MLRRIVDWKFVVAFTFMMLVGYFVYIGLSGSQELAAKGRRIDQLVDLVKDQRTTSKAARIDASRQRDQLLGNQKRLLRQFGRLQDKQDALLLYLSRTGVRVPSSLLQPTSSPQSSPQSTPRPHPGHASGGSSSKPHKPTPKPPSSGGGGTPKPPPSQPSPQPSPQPEPTPPPILCVLVVCVG